MSPLDFPYIYTYCKYYISYIKYIYIYYRITYIGVYIYTYSNIHLNISFSQFLSSKTSKRRPCSFHAKRRFHAALEKDTDATVGAPSRWHAHRTPQHLKAARLGFRRGGVTIPTIAMTGGPYFMGTTWEPT